MIHQAELATSWALPQNTQPCIQAVTGIDMVTHPGSLATINCEPRQARKGATVAVISCAVV